MYFDLHPRIQGSAASAWRLTCARLQKEKGVWGAGDILAVVAVVGTRFLLRTG